MTPAARIQAVIDLLTEVLNTPRPADGVASSYFRSRRYIGSKDRTAINMLLFRIMREYYRLGWWLARAHMDLDARNMTIAALTLDESSGASDIGPLFNGEKFAPEPLSKEERKMIRMMEGQPLVHPDMPLQERTECPDWAFAALQKSLGKNFEKEMSAMLHAAPLDIRVNTIKSTRDEVLQKLRDDGFEAEAGKICPWSIRMFKRPQIGQYPLFQEGHFEIQDEGSQMVALIADAKPGEQVADFCAGAGGKTLALGASMQNKGRIVAMDVLEGRLTRAKERFRRAGLHNIETRVLTSETDRYVKRHPGSFDLVLVDAPCSGTGTWRRDPDKRWRQLGPGLSELVPLQRRILDSVQRMVKPGGRMVYATCSLLPEENENQVRGFLKDHPDFMLRPAREIIAAPGADDFLQLTPGSHDTDGFFAAVLVRKALP